jgi:NADH/F420H2 dehydrogenase subunit C
MSEYSKETESQHLELLHRELSERHPGSVRAVDRSFGDMALTIERTALHDVLAFLKERSFDLLLDIGAVDGLHLGREERFEVVYILYSIARNVRLRLKVFVPESDPTLRTATDLWKAADWAEREAYDMLGIAFEGHPHLIRILTHHEFEGHALRKDYPIMKGQWCSSTRDMREDLEKES